ncbi:ATP-binding protein [Thermobifida alba]|mgnify:CR=1 FL=1|jgi:anti-sigma regulatory factor (Ser/Thr protein kinase)|uniref:ATP-binding protein n=1 Tax=Thermobifida alba TaxID=53522 RepID=A0ABY4L0T6_THEAE|nr:ATP-binding protein [Thermobifida alba]UPT20093.1 ATP-binding protein [Thermobifida alba]HLU97849.1 ATP-binding protein [Thermobifida alba]
MSVSSTVLPGIPDSVAAARAFVVECLRSTPGSTVPDELVERAELITSELATNAVRHTRSGDPGGSYEVRVEVDRSEIRAEVRTREPRTPHTAPHVLPHAGDPCRATGRGLFLVDLLATRWGGLATPAEGVYFVLRWPDRPYPVRA